MKLELSISVVAAIQILYILCTYVNCQNPFLANHTPRTTAAVLPRPRTQPQRAAAAPPRRRARPQPARLVAGAATAPRPQHAAAGQRPAGRPKPARQQQQQQQTNAGPGFRGGFDSFQPGYGGYGSGYGGGGGFGFGYGFGGQWYSPHRPRPDFYHNFASIYRDLDQRIDKSDYNEALEMDEINDDFNGRSIVAPGQYPHMAALGFRTIGHDIEFKCGGSLISEVFVLTAAHCCYFSGQTPEIVKIADINLKRFDFDNMPQIRHVAQIQLHPYYNSSYHYHDIGLILLDRPVIYTHFVRPIRLWVSDNIPYEKVYTMGYGSTTFGQAPTNILTELDLSIVPLLQCNQSLPHGPNSPHGLLETQICAKDYERNRDTCQGDSGGPLQLNLLRRRRRHRFRYYLVGITSYGSVCRSSYPGVYTRVSSYIDWIASVVWPDYFNSFYG